MVNSKKILLVLILAAIITNAFTSSGLLVSNKNELFHPPLLVPKKTSVDLDETQPTLTELVEEQAGSLGGSGQVVFTYYATSKRYWEQGKSAFKFTYTIKSNWFAALAVTVKCMVGEQVGKEFDPEFSESKNHVINPYQSISSSFWLYSTYTSVGLKKIRIYITDTVIPSWIYDTRDLGNQYVQTYRTISDPGPSDYGTETDDLHHPNNWNIILQAGVFCDNTADQYTSAYWINWWTAYNVRDILNSDSETYAFSDLYTIVDGQWWGICDEHAIAFCAMARAMKIPAHFLVIAPQGQGCCPHACAEVWTGYSWIHADPAWFAFNNPTMYQGWGWTNVRAYVVHDSFDWKFSGDPPGDDWLIWFGDMELYDDPPYGQPGYWGY
jgi:transglutaminase-like putative cysteine protease